MDKAISFEQMPQMMWLLMEKLDNIEKLCGNATHEKPTVDADCWMNLKQLQEYLPEHPATATIYGWVSDRKIPFHKGGKALRFRKSEIDQWIGQGKRQDVSQLEAQASQYLSNHKGGRQYE